MGIESEDWGKGTYWWDVVLNYLPSPPWTWHMILLRYNFGTTSLMVQTARRGRKIGEPWYPWQHPLKTAIAEAQASRIIEYRWGDGGWVMDGEAKNGIRK